MAYFGKRLVMLLPGVLLDFHAFRVVPGVVVRVQAHGGDDRPDRHLAFRKPNFVGAQKEREMDESISLSTAKNAEAHFSAGASRSGHAPM